MLAKRKLQFGAVRVVPRDVTLKSLEGWYQLQHPILKKHRESGTKLKLSRWLVTIGHSQLEAERLTKAIKEYSVPLKISCRFNDIYRMSATPHFSTCVTPMGAGQKTPNYIAIDPYSGIVYTPDKAGHFLGRAIFSLFRGEVKILRCYGTVRFEQLNDLFVQLGFSVLPTTDDTVVYYAVRAKRCKIASVIKLKRTLDFTLPRP